MMPEITNEIRLAVLAEMGFTYEAARNEDGSLSEHIITHPEKKGCFINHTNLMCAMQHIPTVFYLLGQASAQQEHWTKQSLQEALSRAGLADEVTLPVERFRELVGIGLERVAVVDEEISAALEACEDAFSGSRFMSQDAQKHMDILKRALQSAPKAMTMKPVEHPAPVDRVFTPHRGKNGPP